MCQILTQGDNVSYQLGKHLHRVRRSHISVVSYDTRDKVSSKCRKYLHIGIRSHISVLNTYTGG